MGAEVSFDLQAVREVVECIDGLTVEGRGAVVGGLKACFPLQEIYGRASSLQLHALNANLGNVVRLENLGPVDRSVDPVDEVGAATLVDGRFEISGHAFEPA